MDNLQIFTLVCQSKENGSLLKLDATATHFILLAYEDSNALIFRSRGPDVSLIRAAMVQKNCVVRNGAKKLCVVARGLDFHELLMSGTGPLYILDTTFNMLRNKREK